MRLDSLRRNLSRWKPVHRGAGTTTAGLLADFAVSHRQQTAAAGCEKNCPSQARTLTDVWIESGADPESAN